MSEINAYYNPPQSALDDVPSKVKKKWFRKLLWIVCSSYEMFLVYLFVSVMIESGVDYSFVGNMIIILFGLLGFFAYAFQYRVLNHAFWKAVFFSTVLWVSGNLLTMYVSAKPGEIDQGVIQGVLITLPTTVIRIVVLFILAFKSERMWGKKRSCYGCLQPNWTKNI